MLSYFTFLLFLASVAAFSTTICNCNKPKGVGLLQFSDGSCEPAKRAEKTKVDYRVMTDKKAAFTFPGYICARWKAIKNITVNFVGQVIIVPERMAMETTAIECDIMRQSRRCNDNPMTRSENKWVFNQEPDDVGYWLRTTTDLAVNCMMEEIILSRINEGDIIDTPLGKTNVSHGSLSHNHLTLFWIDTYAKSTEISSRQLEKGVGYWYESSTNGTWILQDDSKQLDFHVRLMTRCQTVKCDKKIESWTIVGDNNLFIIKYPLSPGPATVPSVIKNMLPKLAEPLDTNIRQNSRIQYLEDAAIRHENKLIRVI